MKISRTSALVAYWVVAIIIVAMILLSLDYSFAKALFMSSLFLPGAVAAKFFLAQVKKDTSSKSVMNAVYIFGAIAVMEFLLIVCGHRLLEYVFRTISVQCSGDTRSLLSGKDRLLATKLILFS